jgi:hypothetical protein
VAAVLGALQVLPIQAAIFDPGDPGPSVVSLLAAEAAQVATATIDCQSMGGQRPPRQPPHALTLVPFVGWSFAPRTSGSGSGSPVVDLYLHPSNDGAGAYLGTIALERSRPHADVALDLGARHGSWSLDWSVEHAGTAARTLSVVAQSRCGLDQTNWTVTQAPGALTMTIDAGRRPDATRGTHAVLSVGGGTRRSISFPGVGFGAPRIVRQPSGGTGYTVSFPQCNDPPPPTPFAHAVLGVNGGRPFTRNPCLAQQFTWARQGTTPPALYLNTASPSGAHVARAFSGPAGDCGPDDAACQAYNYGYNGAEDAYAYASSQGATAMMWWVDVELENTWSDDTSLNALVIRGAIDALRKRGAAVGIYSTSVQWHDIAGSYRPAVPTWVAGASSLSEARGCSALDSFGGGTLWFTEYPVGALGGFYIC